MIAWTLKQNHIFWTRFPCHSNLKIHTESLNICQSAAVRVNIYDKTYTCYDKRLNVQFKRDKSYENCFVKTYENEYIYLSTIDLKTFNDSADLQ